MLLILELRLRLRMLNIRINVHILIISDFDEMCPSFNGSGLAEFHFKFVYL